MIMPYRRYVIMLGLVFALSACASQEPDRLGSTTDGRCRCTSSSTYISGENQQHIDWRALAAAVTFYARRGWQLFHHNYGHYDLLNAKDVPIFLVGPNGWSECIAAYEGVVVCRSTELLAAMIMGIPEPNRPKYVLFINELVRDSGRLHVSFSGGGLVLKNGQARIQHSGVYVSANVINDGDVWRMEYLGTSGS